MLDIISSVREEGMLNIKTMSVKLWYKYLLEVQVTHTEPEDNCFRYRHIQIKLC